MKKCDLGEFLGEGWLLSELIVVRCDSSRLTNENIPGKAFRLGNGMLDSPVHNLETLDLDNNELTEVNKEWFVKLVNLISLFLSNNKLTKVIDAPFALLFNLNTLDFQDNQINSFAINISNLKQLNRLILSDNSLTILEPKYFESFINSKENTSRRYIFISDNKLTCECPMLDISEWRRTNNVSIETLNQHCYGTDKMKSFPLQCLISLHSDICDMEGASKIAVIAECRG